MKRTSETNAIGHGRASFLLGGLGALGLAACQAEDHTSRPDVAPAMSTESAAVHVSTDDEEMPMSGVEGLAATATFAGGCFWCVEAPFEKVAGVQAVISGYAGGHVDDPTYQEVCSGTTGHTEAVQILYDPRQVSYDDLLEILWRQINPTDAGGQFVDRGTQYRSEIFFHNDEQRVVAEKSKQALGESGRFDSAIVTAVTPLDVFYPAEKYHQDYYKKSPANYERYRSGSGRDRYLDKVWGDDRKYHPKGASADRWSSFVKPNADELRSQLTGVQYSVTQEEGTERPFQNEFWDNHAVGIYVDIVSGEPLFSSLHKFKSGTGWPSFDRPLEPGNIHQDTDKKLGYIRDEVRSRHADSHLGHVFDDGPKSTGLRYCINSAALRFVPVTDLESQGYGKYSSSFE